MCGHIYKCGKCKCHIYRNIQISDTNGTLYEHREAHGGLGHAGAGHTHATHTQTCGARALHVILFQGASRSTAAFHKRSTAACTSQTFDSCTSQTFDSCTSVLLHLGDRKKIVAVPSNCADHYAFLCQTVVEWTGECRL